MYMNDNFRSSTERVILTLNSYLNDSWDAVIQSVCNPSDALVDSRVSNKAYKLILIYDSCLRNVDLELAAVFAERVGLPRTAVL